MKSAWSDAKEMEKQALKWINQFSIHESTEVLLQFLLCSKHRISKLLWDQLFIKTKCIIQSKYKLKLPKIIYFYYPTCTQLLPILQHLLFNWIDSFRLAPVWKFWIKNVYTGYQNLVHNLFKYYNIKIQ